MLVQKNNTLPQVYWKYHAHITKLSMWTHSQTVNYMSVTTMKSWIEQKPVGHRLVENRIEVLFFFFFFAMIKSGWPWFKIKLSETQYFYIYVKIVYWLIQRHGNESFVKWFVIWLILSFHLMFRTGLDLLSSYNCLSLPINFHLTIQIVAH